LFAALLSAVVLTSAGARADGPTAADRETARGLLDEGNTRLAANDLNGALAAFSAADAMMHVPTTGIAVARVQAQLGLLVDARDTALRVARHPVTPNDPPIFADARAAAEELSTQLAPRIPTLRINVTGLGTNVPRVLVDDVAIPADALLAPRKLNPGHHTVVVKVDTREARGEIDLVERDAKTLTLDVPAPPTDAPGPSGGAVQGGSPHRPDTVAPRKSTSPLVYAGFGVGIVGVVVGSVSGILSLSKAGSLSSSCPEYECPPSAHDDLSTARTTGNIATVAFVVAGVGAAVGVVGLFMSGGSAKVQASSARIEPWIGADRAGVSGRF